jgi:hypothetical protein
MRASLMSQSQQSSAAGWTLSEGRAIRLPAHGRTRWLEVTEGRLWLTHSARSAQDLPLDCWLQAGESVVLPAGQDAVLESWPSARFQLLEQAPAGEPVSASVALKPSAARRRWLQAVRPSSSPRAAAPARKPSPTPCAS